MPNSLAFEEIRQNVTEILLKIGILSKAYQLCLDLKNKLEKIHQVLYLLLQSWGQEGRGDDING